MVPWLLAIKSTETNMYWYILYANTAVNVIKCTTSFNLPNNSVHYYFPYFMAERYVKYFAQEYVGTKAYQSFNPGHHHHLHALL